MSSGQADLRVAARRVERVEQRLSVVALAHEGEVGVHVELLEQDVVGEAREPGDVGAEPATDREACVKPRPEATLRHATQQQTARTSTSTGPGGNQQQTVWPM